MILNKCFQMSPKIRSPGTEPRYLAYGLLFKLTRLRRIVIFRSDNLNDNNIMCVIQRTKEKKLQLKRTAYNQQLRLFGGNMLAHYKPI